MNMSIGNNIRIMRRKCGFTQEELAARLSVTPQAVSKWENGGGLPDLSQIVPLAQIFGITTDFLLGAASAVYGKAHTEAALGHEKLLMSTSLPLAEKHLAFTVISVRNLKRNQPITPPKAMQEIAFYSYQT